MRVQFRRLTEADLPKILRMNQDFRQGFADPEAAQDRKSTRLNSSHYQQSRMPSSA